MKAQIEVYRFEDLPERAKSRVIEREAAMWEFNDHDYIQEQAAQLGLTLDPNSIEWSGLDGNGVVNYTGTYSCTEEPGEGLDEPLKDLQNRLNSLQKAFNNTLSATISKRWRRSSVEVSIQFERPDKDLKRTIKEWDVLIQKEMDMQEEVTQIFREFADWIKFRIRDDFEYAISEECIEETCTANDYWFDQYGNLICIDEEEETQHQL